jgi:hypothetical protein
MPPTHHSSASHAPSKQPPQPDEGGADLEGDVAKIGLLDLVQFLDASQHRGTISVAYGASHTAQCTLGADGFASGRCAQLRGYEALLAMLGWRAGRFSFRGGEPSSPVIASIPSVIMEAVRLEDELERVIGELPPPHAPLRLRPTSEAPNDPLGCGLQDVHAFIRQKPGVLLSDLERAMPLAPIKVRLAVCVLLRDGHLRTGLTLPPLSTRSHRPPSAGDWYASLSARYGAIVRVLVATSPQTDSRELTAWVHALAAAIDASPTSISLAQSGPSFVRLRRRDDALLSLTFLPLRKKHRYLFHSFAGTSVLSMFTEDASLEEIDDWRDQLAAGAARCHLVDERTPDCLVRSLRAVSEAGQREERAG